MDDSFEKERLLVQRRNKPLLVHVRSLGCKVNLADAQEAISCLGEGVRIEAQPGRADVVLLNTCTVTHKADRDARKILGSLGKSNPGLPVVVTGCAAKTCASVLAGYANVKSVVEPGRPERLAEALTRAAAGARFHEAAVAGAGRAMAPFGRQRAFLKVQDGCNNRCAYCVVPLVRGEERSMPPAEVEARFSALMAAGIMEIVLVGIHLGRYGLERGQSLVWLLRQTEQWAGRCSWQGRIRLSSIEPQEWSEELLEYFAGSSRICPHVHVPVQSASAQVLARMGRPPVPDANARLIERLAASRPDMAIGTDVVTGFPQETESEAEETLRWIEELPFSYLHVFTYSKRPGTAAAELSGQVASDIIRMRSERLREVGKQKWLRFLAKGIGRPQRVLLERKTRDGCTGRSESYRKIRLDGPCAGSTGQIVPVIGTVVRDGWLLAVRAGEA